MYFLYVSLGTAFRYVYQSCTILDLVLWYMCVCVCLLVCACVYYLSYCNKCSAFWFTYCSITVRHLIMCIYKVPKNVAYL